MSKKDKKGSKRRKQSTEAAKEIVKEQEVQDKSQDEPENQEESAADNSQNADEGNPVVEEDNEDVQEAKVKPSFVSDGRYRNKQRCLTLCSRGVTSRYRHLLEDLRTLIPHHKKESKLDAGDENLGSAIEAVAEIRGCNTVLFMECKKRRDCYMYVGRVGGHSPGPTVKFHVTNIHTMDELRLTGNCMKHSRPILSFDESFGRLGHLKLMKELFVDVFGTPRGHPKSKPFVDRVMAFYFADHRIWVRNYQILEQKPETAREAHQAKKNVGLKQATSLVEIGPRFVLNPIRIFRGSFGGQTLFQNPNFVSPNELRAEEKRFQGKSYVIRKQTQKAREERKAEIVVPEDPLATVFR